MAPERDPRELIPATLPKGDYPRPSSKPIARVINYTIPYRDIQLQNPGLDIEVGPCDRLRMVGTHGISIFVDSEPVYRLPDQIPIPPVILMSNRKDPLSFDGVGGLYDSAGSARWMNWPSFDFTLERPCDLLQLRIDDRVRAEYNGDQMPGIIHIFGSSGPARNNGWGEPISHSLERSVIDLGVSPQVIEPIRPTLHGDNLSAFLGSVEFGLHTWVPRKTQVTGMSFRIDWAAGPATVQQVVLRMIEGSGNYFNLGRWYFGQVGTYFNMEFPEPIEVPTWLTRKWDNASDQGALSVALTTSVVADGASVILRFRSWL